MERLKIIMLIFVAVLSVISLYEEASSRSKLREEQERENKKMILLIDHKIDSLSKSLNRSILQADQTKGGYIHKLERELYQCRNSHKME